MPWCCQAHEETFFARKKRSVYSSLVHTQCMIVWFAGSCETSWSTLKIHFWSLPIFQIHELNMDVIPQISKPTMFCLEISFFVFSVRRFHELSWACSTQRWMLAVGHWPSRSTVRAQEILSNMKVRDNVQTHKLHYKFLKVFSFSSGGSDLDSNLGFKYVNTFLEIGLTVSVIHISIFCFWAFPLCPLRQ